MCPPKEVSSLDQSGQEPVLSTYSLNFRKQKCSSHQSKSFTDTQCRTHFIRPTIMNCSTHLEEISKKVAGKGPTTQYESLKGRRSFLFPRRVGLSSTKILARPCRPKFLPELCPPGCELSHIGPLNSFFFF